MWLKHLTRSSFVVRQYQRGSKNAFWPTRFTSAALHMYASEPAETWWGQYDLEHRLQMETENAPSTKFLFLTFKFCIHIHVSIHDNQTNISYAQGWQHKWECSCAVNKPVYSLVYQCMNVWIAVSIFFSRHSAPSSMCYLNVCFSWISSKSSIIWASSWGWDASQAPDACSLAVWH